MSRLLKYYAECRYAECRDYLNVMLSVVRLNVVMLSVVAPLEDKLIKGEVQAMDRARKGQD